MKKEKLEEMSENYTLLKVILNSVDLYEKTKIKSLATDELLIFERTKSEHKYV